MPAKGMVKHDWPLLYQEFGLVQDRDPTVTLARYCDDKGLSYTNCSRHFADISEAIKVATESKLRKLAPKAVDRIGKIVDSKDDGLALKAGQAILDRAGHSPQAVTLNVQANAQANQALIIPPMFGQEDADELKKLLGGSEEADCLSDHGP